MRVSREISLGSSLHRASTDALIGQWREVGGRLKSSLVSIYVHSTIIVISDIS